MSGHTERRADPRAALGPFGRPRHRAGRRPTVLPRGLVGALWALGIAVVVLVLLPPAYLVVRALGAADTAWAVLVRPATLAVLLRSLALAGAVTVLSALIAVPLAWLTVLTDLPGRRFFAVATALPLVIPSYVGAYLLVAALGPRGMLQGALEPLGVARLPPIYGFPGALMAITLFSYPYVLLTARAALQRLDPALLDASRSLGVGAWGTFRRVVLPQLRPAIAAGSLLVALYALRDFGAVAIMRYDTFTRVIFVQYQSAFDRTGAAVLALVLVAVSLVLLSLEARARGRARYYRGEGGVRRPPRRIALGRWRWPAVAFCGAVVLLALVLPAGVLGFWLVRGLRAGEQLPALRSAATNSLLAGTLAAGTAVVAALPVAVLSVRRPGRASRWVEQLSYLGFALPGIVVALALVFFGARYAGPLYQTLPLLIVAYVILFLPQAVGALRTSLLQVQPRLEESARSLGRSPLGVFRSVTLPLVAPGVASGAALVFLTTLKELPATLILSPLGFPTLATSVWAAVSEAFFARAAAPALLLVLVSSVPLALLTLREPGGAA